MPLLSKFRSYARSLTHRSAVESDIEAELRSHIALRADDLASTGLSPSEALRRARIEFGTIETHKAEIRSSLGLRLFDELLSDLRFAARMLRRSPGFTAVAIISLALGIGANTIIFTLAKGVLLDRLAVPHPNELRLLSTIGDQHSPAHRFWGENYVHPEGQLLTTFSYPVLEVLRDQNSKSPVLEDLFAFKALGYHSLTVTTDHQADVASGELVSENYFEQLGIAPQLGRPIQPSDDAITDSGSVAVISDSLWSRLFGRSPSVLGKIIQINSIPVTIIGVAPAGFIGATSVHLPSEIFLPFSLQPLIAPSSGSTPSSGGGSLLKNKSMWWVSIMARAKPGISDEAARAALQVSLSQAIRATMPVGKDDQIPRLVLSPGRRGLDENVKSTGIGQRISILGVLTGLLLLLACANLANLLLARSATRQREMSVRLALGATRSRVMRQVFTESLLLSLFGGIAGLFLGYIGRNTIPYLLSSSWLPVPLINTNFDNRIFAFTTAVSIGTGILFGVIPAWRATQTNVSTALKDSVSIMTRRRKGLLGKGLVIFQIALSSLLVVGATLFTLTFIHLGAVDLGFNPKSLLLFSIRPTSSRYPAPQIVALHQRIEERLAQVPGVEFIAPSTVSVVVNDIHTDSFQPTDQPRRTADPPMERNEVGWQFFQAYGIPMLSGRNFNATDTTQSPLIAVINQTLAKQDYPNINPVGKTFRTVDSPIAPIYRIIGVVPDAKYNDLREQPPPAFYLLYNQQKEGRGMSYTIRTPLSTSAMLPSLRSALLEIDKDLPLRDPHTQSERIEAGLLLERLLAVLSSAFGILALILAAIGIYGIMAFTVARRTSEIGVRMALGARPRQVRLMVLRESGWMAIVGIAIGLAASIALARLIRAMLYGLTPTDPTTLIGTAFLLLAMAVAAAYGPARRASRIDPMQALRHE